MKIGISAVWVVAVLLVESRARPSDTPADVETDHLDAADEGGPRTAGLVLHPVALSLGRLGGEVDVAVGQNVALSLGAEGSLSEGGAPAGVTIGGLLFPQLFAFHGLYVCPGVEWKGALSSTTPGALGPWATLGYEWTWRVGATLRLGGGISYRRAIGTNIPSAAQSSLQPKLDASVGWLF